VVVTRAVVAPVVSAVITGTAATGAAVVGAATAGITVGTAIGTGAAGTGVTGTTGVGPAVAAGVITVVAGLGLVLATVVVAGLDTVVAAVVAGFGVVAVVVARLGFVRTALLSQSVAVVALVRLTLLLGSVVGPRCRFDKRAVGRLHNKCADACPACDEKSGGRASRESGDEFHGLSLPGGCDALDDCRDPGRARSDRWS
jgi:hypothetical protein